MTVAPNKKLGIDEFPLRIGFIVTGLILFDLATKLSEGGQSFEYPASIGLSFAAWVAGIALVILAMTPRPNLKWSWLVLLGLIFVQLGHVYIQVVNFTPLTNQHLDNGAIAEYAVQALRNGHNPYSWNFSDIQRVFNDRVYVTPFLDGAIQNRVTYPALQILILQGFSLLGIQQGEVLAIGFHILLLVLLFVGTPPKLRAIVLLPLFILKDFVILSMVGVQDVVWSALLVALIMLWKRPVWRALLFGLACSFRHQPWLVAPFILIYLWHEGGTTSERRQRIAVFSGISLGVFLVVNLPFIIWEPRAWWLGAFEPAYARFDLVGFGLSLLSEYGLAPFPREFYAGLQLATLLIMLTIHWRHPKVVGNAFWIFPAIFFWLYYRSLYSYWIYWIPPLLLVLGRQLGSIEKQGVPFGKGHARAARTAAFAGVLLVANLAFGSAFVLRQPPIVISSSPPFETFAFSDQLVNRLRVTVTNTSGKVLAPRFAFQRDILRAVPWDIETGPERLAQGQTGEYLISTPNWIKSISGREGGQIVVTDAGGDYFLRAILTIPPDPGIKDPDHIANPDFSYWPAGGDSPRGWELRAQAGTSALAMIETIDGVEALTLGITSAYENNEQAIVRLSQTISFPDSFAVSVYPKTSSSDPREHAYGLELDDGKRRLWILFGDSDDTGMMGKDSAYIFIRSPLNAWSRHLIQLKDLYTFFGWSLPHHSLRISNGMEFQARQVKLSLLSMPKSADQDLAVFGAIELNREAPIPKALVAEALEHPETYYVNVGDEYRRQRNYDLAQGAYLRALTYNEVSPGGSFGLGESSFWLGDYDQAIAAFQDSIQQEYRLAESYRGVGWSALSLGEVDLSELSFLSAIEVDPSFPDAYVGLGWVFVDLDRCDQAIPHFERALSLNSSLLEAETGIEECRSRETTRSSAAPALRNTVPSRPLLQGLHR